MLKIYSKIVLLILLTSCSSSSSKLKYKQANLYFSAGTQSLMEQDYTAALTSLLKANELNPENSEIITNLGMAYYFKGEKDIAIRHLHEALKLKESNSDARVNLASIHFKSGNYTEAERLYKDVLKDLTYDKQARTYYNLGLIKIQIQKNTAAAENYFKRSLKEDENYCPAFFQLALINFERREFNTALRNFKAAGSGTCYESPAPHYYQGLSLLELGKLDEARMKFEEIDTRFKRSNFAIMARTKAMELRNIEMRQQKAQTQALKNTKDKYGY